MRSCSPTGAPASSSTTSAARCRASARTPNRRPPSPPRSSPPAASAIADTSDVATAAGAQALVDAAVEQFGRLDILINNAGIIRWAGFPEADADNLATHLAVHVGGSFNTTRAAWPHMVEQGYGRIVMTTSDGDVRTARTTSPTPPPRAGSSDSRAASRPPAPRTASRSTSSHPRPARAWRAGPDDDGLQLVAGDVAGSRRTDGRLPRPRGLPGQRRDLRRRRGSLRAHLHRRRPRATSTPTPDADDRGRRRGTGRRSTTRPATTSRPTSPPGRPTFMAHLCAAAARTVMAS